MGNGQTGKWVVIPTIGRTNLELLISQILADASDSLIDVKILVALNGSKNLDSLSSTQVQVARISEIPIGVAKTMNAALRMIPSGLVWTIADDEEWCTGKFLSDLRDLSRDTAPDILSPIAFFQDELGIEIRPKTPIKPGEEILDYFYGKVSFGRNPNYFSLSGAVAEKETWTRVEFPEGLLSREDTLYLVEQERLGTTFGHASKPTVRIAIDLGRAVERDNNVSVVINWANSNLTDKQFIGLVGCAWCKPFVASRKTLKLLEMIIAISSQRNPKFSFSTRMKTIGLLVIWSLLSLLPINQIARIRQNILNSHKRNEA